MKITIYLFVGILFFSNFGNLSNIKEFYSVDDDPIYVTERYHSDNHFNTTIHNKDTKVATLVSSACPQYTCPGTAGCTYIISGSDATNYNVYSGEKICLEPGANFTGQVGFYGGEMQNCATAPQNFTYFTNGASPSSTFNNYGTFQISGTPDIQDSLVINNYGTFSVNSMTISSDAVFNNYCTTTSASDLLIEATGTLNNFRNIDITSFFANDANTTVTLTNGCITADQFFNEGTIEGLICGNITIAGNSTNTTTGSLIGSLAFIDLTPPASAPFIDSNSGSVGAGVVWTSCTDCSLTATEICKNGIDDNGDGRIDEAYPGGVQTNLQLWLDAEQGTNTTQSGFDVISWSDQSPNGYSANADVNSTDDPTFLNNAINFHPGVTFDGTYTDDFSDGLHLGSDYIYSTNAGMHVFSVLKPNGSALQYRHPFHFGGTVDALGYSWSTSASRTRTPQSFGGNDSFNNHASGAVPSLVEFEIKFNDTQTLYKEGSVLNQDAIPTLNQITAAEIPENNVYGDLISGPVSIGRKSSSQYLNTDRIFSGEISEVLVYNDTLSQVDKEKVNSYLAIKYGMTVPHNYVFSDGTIIKDVTDGYANNIAGIAIDSCGALIQKQSKSVNDSSIISIALGSFSATNSINPWSFNSDKSALVWGHNGAAANTSWNGTNYDIPNGGYLGIDRVWKFTETQDVQNVVLRVDVNDPEFDLPALPPFPAADGAYHLFIDDDGDFTNGGTTVQKMTFVSGSVWETTIADPANSYFSIGRKVPEICNDGADNDGDGDIDCADEDCNTIFYAASQTNSSVSIPANALGAPDGQEALLGPTTHIILDLGSALDIGEDYVITLRYLFSSSTMTIEESIDGINFFAATNSPYAITYSTLTDVTFTTNVHTRYLRLTPDLGTSFALDAVTYGNCVCQPTATTTEEYNINSDPHVPGNIVNAFEGDLIRLEFVGTGFDTWTFIWTGPNALYQVTDSGTNRDRILLNNIQLNQAGEYKMVYFDDVGCVDSTTFTVYVSPLIEICNNGIDDDGDGDIDCADADCPLFTDTDGDLICDATDLDDDNDGIPDIDEWCVTDTILIWNEITPSFNNVSNGAPSADQSVSYTNTEGDFNYTFEVDNPDDNYFNQVSIGNYQALGINATALDSLGDFAELTIKIDNIPSGIIMQEILFTIDDIDQGGSVNTREVVTVVGYNGATAISPTVTAQQTGFLIINPPALDSSVTITTTTSDNLPFLPGDTNAAGTAEQAAIDISFSQPIDRIVIRYSQTGEISSGGLGVRQFMGTYCEDADGDGVPNLLDLDSDNDGIYDLHEAGLGSLDVNSDGILDGASAAFGTNGLLDGVETVADNGILNYTIPDSETTPNGTYDAYQTDADGDGCFDTVEEGVADPDGDGIAGTGAPSVNLEGLVNGVTYTAPPNNDWQNPGVSLCIPSCDAQAPVISKN